MRGGVGESHENRLKKAWESSQQGCTQSIFVPLSFHYYHDHHTLTFFSSLSLTIAFTRALTFKATIKTPQLLLNYWQQGTWWVSYFGKSGLVSMRRASCRPLCQSFSSPSDTQNHSCLLKRTELLMSLLEEEEEERGTSSCECGSGITRVVMTWSVLCSPALFGSSIKALCQELCLAMAWSHFCSTNS